MIKYTRKAQIDAYRLASPITTSSIALSYVCHSASPVLAFFLLPSRLSQLRYRILLLEDYLIVLAFSRKGVRKKHPPVQDATDLLIYDGGVAWEYCNPASGPVSNWGSLVGFLKTL